MLNVRLYMIQRISAMIMAPLVLAHIAVMIYAIQGGLSSAEILERTQGSIAWMLYYAIFVLAVSVHAAIGMRVILHEELRLSGAALEVFTWVFGTVLLVMGGRAVMAVTLA